MGMYCCCDQKIGDDGEWECLCDWEGWVSTGEFPVERKNKDIPISQPPVSGNYWTRYTTGSADRYEIESYFSVTPLRKDRMEGCWYSKDPLVDVHWSDWDSETGGPYAWKKKD
jgi:hypothetical protein